MKKLIYQICFYVTCAISVLVLAFSISFLANKDEYYKKEDIQIIIEDLEKYINDKYEESQLAIESLNDEYEILINDLEEANEQNESLIKALEEEYNGKVEELEAEDAENKALLESLRSEYESKVEELEANDAENKALIKELEEEYNAKVEALEAEDASNKALLETLRSEYESKVEELEANDAANEALIKELEEEYNAKVEALEAEDAENKALLESLRSEYESKVEELEASDAANEALIKALEEEYNAKVEALEAEDAENKALLETLRSEYESKVEELEASDAANEALIKALEEEYNAKVEELEAEDAENKALLESLRSEYESKVEELEASDAANEALIKALEEEYNAKVEELEAEDASNKALLESLRSEYESKVEELNDLIESNYEKIYTLEQDLQEKVDEINNKYDDKLQNVEVILESLKETSTSNQNEIARLIEQVEAILDIPTYIVEFNTNGAGNIDNQVVEHGDKINVPPSPSKQGYIFDGWYYGDEKWSFGGDVVTEDMVLTAMWVEAYEIPTIQFEDATYTYDGITKTLLINNPEDLPDGLVVMYSNNKLLDVGQTVAFAYIMDYTGYIYETHTAVLTIEKATLTFTMDDLNVDYNGNKHYLSINETLPKGVKVTYINNGQVNAGQYTVTAKFTVDNNYNEINDITATININKIVPQITVSHDSTNFTLEDELILNVEGNVDGQVVLAIGQSLTIGTRSYKYIFYPEDSINYSNVTGNVSITVYSKVEFYDIDGKLLDIQYIEKNGLINDFTPVYDDNSGYKYTFRGWVFQGGIFNTSNEISSNISLTASYDKELIIYTITYILNGGETSFNLENTYTVLDTVYIPELEKYGNNFVGWYGEDLEEYTKSFELSNALGDRIYYAYFEPVQVNVTLNLNGGTSDVTLITINYGDTINLPSPTLFGYEFDGWYYNGQKVNNGDKFYFVNDITLKAKYIQSEFVYIYTAEELSYVAYSLDGKYYLMNDIDLGGVEWTPLGDDTFPFSGTFEGNGFTISNFTISVNSDYTGLFGASTGKINNLNIKDAIITAGSIGASILVGRNFGNISNCHVDGNINVDTTYLGALISYNSGDIEYSSSLAYVCGGTYMGNLIGYSEGGKIQYSYSKGCVENINKVDIYIGGLIGYITNVFDSENSINHEFLVSNCFSLSNINSNYEGTIHQFSYHIGGLIGYTNNVDSTNIETSGKILKSYYDGELTSSINDVNDTSAKFVYNITVYVGGFVSFSNSTIYESCYSNSLLDINNAKTKSYMKSVGSQWWDSRKTGDTITNIVGGLIAEDTNSTINNCYSLVNINNTNEWKRHYFDDRYGSYYMRNYIGALVGRTNKTFIDKTYSTGNINNIVKSSACSFSHYSGGYYDNRYIEPNDFSLTSYIGGLCGFSLSSIFNSYSSVEITENDVSIEFTSSTDYSGTNLYNKYGGLCGSNNSSIDNCYRYSGTNSNVTLGTPTTITNLKSVNFITNVLGWDKNIWTLANGKYPTLELYTA